MGIDSHNEDFCPRSGTIVVSSGTLLLLSLTLPHLNVVAWCIPHTITLFHTLLRCRQLCLSSYQKELLLPQ